MNEILFPGISLSLCDQGQTLDRVQVPYRLSDGVLKSDESRDKTNSSHMCISLCLRQK